ncbi:MAG: hypothetical protein WBK55_09540 [Alphaproteobacteria bacterium]
MRNSVMREVESLENVIFICFNSDGVDLPQIADDDGAVIDLMQEMTGRPFHEVETEFYHQNESA